MCKYVYVRVYIYIYICELAPKVLFRDAAAFGGHRCWVSAIGKHHFSKSACPARLACTVGLLRVSVTLSVYRVCVKLA